MISPLYRGEVDRFGYLIPRHYGNVLIPNAVATFRPGEGPFGGGAVAVESTTTNLANNPLFIGEVGTQPPGWHRDVTIQQDSFFGRVMNVAELLCEPGNAFEDFGVSIPYPLQFDTVYTISFWARGTINFGFDYSTNRGFVAREWKSQPPISLEWQKYEVTVTTASSGNIVPFWIFVNNVDDANVGKWVRIAHPQLEQKSFATSFTPSGRGLAKLDYPVAFNMAEGTVSLWFYFRLDIALNTLRGTIFRVKEDAGGALRDHFWLLTTTELDSSELRFQIRRSDGTTIPPFFLADFVDITDGWHHAAIRWSTQAGTLEVFLDGVLKLSYSYPITDFLPSKAIDIGCRGSTDPFNSMVSDLLILPRAVDDTELAALASGPAPVYPDSLLQWDWTPVREAKAVTLGGVRL